MKFFKSILAIAILAFGLCFVGCDNAEQTEVKQVNAIEEEQSERGVAYYTDAEITYIEIVDGETTVYCVDAWGERYAFRGEGFNIGDKVQLEMNDNNTENDIYDDTIEDVRIY